MFSKKKILFNLVQNTFVGLAVTITVTLFTTGFISVGAFIVSFLKAYVINFIACLIIPTDKLTSLTCKGFKCDPDGLLAKVVNVLYCDVCYVTVISVVMFILELGFSNMAFQAWKSVYLPLLVVGFVVGFLMGPISMKISGMLSKEK